MSLTRRNLLDLNVLIALSQSGHTHRQVAERWFQSAAGSDWGICPLTESGFIRLATNPAMQANALTVNQAVAVLQSIQQLAGYRFWPITHSWVDLTAPFSTRITGHQQVTDAYLLGLAIKQDGVLVTFDRGIRYMAGPQFAKNVLLLQ